MGGLDELLKPVASVLGIGAALDPTGLTSLALNTVGLGQGPSLLSAGGAIGGILSAPGELVQTLTGGLLGGVGAANGAVDATGFGGGNGRTATRTVVETMDLASGTIIRRRMLPGSPFLMNSDVKAAKRVFKKSADLAKRIPRKTIRQSPTQELKDAAIEAAIRKANQSDERAVIVKT